MSLPQIKYNKKKGDKKRTAQRCSSLAPLLHSFHLLLSNAYLQYFICKWNVPVSQFKGVGEGGGGEGDGVEFIGSKFVFQFLHCELEFWRYCCSVVSKRVT